MDSANIKKLILHKLIRANIWGGKHTPLDIVMKGIPEQYRNTHKGQKAINDAMKELIKDRWIILMKKKTRKGTDEHLSLNPRKVGEIREYLERN